VVVPIHSVAFVAVIVTGYFNDKILNFRGAVIAGWLTLAMVCSVIVCAVENFTARYVLLVFMASSLSASNAPSLAYASLTYGPMQQETRADSLAFVNAMANLSQIYGACLFPSHETGKYLKGSGVISGLCAVGAIIYYTAHVLVRRYLLQA
jgi:MFS family permease